MTTYSQLSYSARARLAKRDPVRFRALKAEHEGNLRGLEAKLTVARSHAERKELRGEIAALGVAGTLAALPEARPALVASRAADADRAMAAAQAGNPQWGKGPRAVTNADLARRNAQLLALPGSGRAIGCAVNMPPLALEAYNRGLQIMAARLNNDGPEAA